MFYKLFLGLLQATASGLEQKLGKLAPAHAVAGNISPYFVERFVPPFFGGILKSIADLHCFLLIKKKKKFPYNHSTYETSTDKLILINAG